MKYDLIQAKVLESYFSAMVDETEANDDELAEIEAMKKATTIEELVSAVEEAIGDTIGAHEFILRAIMEE